MTKNHWMSALVAKVDNCKPPLQVRTLLHLSIDMQDWVPSPARLCSLPDPSYRRFALSLNARWRSLCRRIKEDVRDRPELYTLLYLPNPVVVPGGRFR